MYPLLEESRNPESPSTQYLRTSGSKNHASNLPLEPGTSTTGYLEHGPSEGLMASESFSFDGPDPNRLDTEADDN